MLLDTSIYIQKITLKNYIFRLITDKKKKIKMYMWVEQGCWVNLHVGKICTSTKVCLRGWSYNLPMVKLAFMWASNPYIDSMCNIVFISQISIFITRIGIWVLYRQILTCNNVISSPLHQKHSYEPGKAGIPALKRYPAWVGSGWSTPYECSLENIYIES